MTENNLHNALHTPVLLNVFNRPEETNRVLEVLALQKVPVLYVHCDGVREGRDDDDVRNVTEVQRLIKDTVTWQCELHTMYEEHNYGCGVGPYRAISWFFENVEEGIILEDDCVPHPDFFMYCQELLARYRDNEHIAVIGGTNRHPDKHRTNDSYLFSPFPETWGWATWRRVWKEYDYDFMVTDAEYKHKVWPFLKSYGATLYGLNLLRKMRKDVADKSYWDFQLDLICMYTNKLSIIPSVNMVSNIGFNERATHTFGSSHTNTPVSAIMPLVHPNCIRFHYSVTWEYNVILRNCKQFIKRIIKRKRIWSNH